MMCALRFVDFLAISCVLVSFVWSVHCCDLEQFFSDKQVSVEESADNTNVIFRGLRRAATPPSPNEISSGVFTAYFELINTYKGAEELDVWDFSNYRRINVTFLNHPLAECQFIDDIPREYIVFCDLVGNELRALSVAKWDDSTDQRVWTALGWSEWSEWSSCSVSCSAGIQQRTRHCRLAECPGFNIEQRHCNLFGCDSTVNPLALEESRFFHPSKEKWQRVPARPTAWRLKPNSYIWVPSTQLFTGEKTGPFPRQFVLFITMRLQNSSMGTIFSLRSRRREDSYLSLELAGTDLKLIHVSANGTDVVRIPTTLGDGKWHQISISVRDDSVVETYIDCEWSRTDVLKRDSLDIPEDSDVIIGYLFSGDLDQLSIVSDPSMVGLQCSTLRIPIIDPSVKDEREVEEEVEKMEEAEEKKEKAKSARSYAQHHRKEDEDAKT